MGEPTLQVLSDHVDVLEVALEQILVVNRRHAGRVVDGVDHLGREPDAVRRGETERRAVVQGDGAGRRGGPDLADRFGQEGPAGAQVGLGLPDAHLDHRLIAQQRLHGARRLGAGQLEERLQARARHSERGRGVARGEQHRAGDSVQRPGLDEGRRHGEDGALGGHEDVLHGEVVGPRAPHAVHAPGVEQLGVGSRHEHVTRLRLTLVESRLAARERRVRHDAARRVDPDHARDVARHPRRVGREDRALVDDPGGAGVRFPQLFDHLDVGRQVELRAAQGARERQAEQAGVGERLEERARELTRRVGLLGAGPDLGDQLPGGVERRRA